jgi:hypothetical protein
MSYANQPSRLLISSDDLAYGQGNNFNITLPEPITGATTVDLIRAVIPNTGYTIPPYQENLYLIVNGTPVTVLMPRIQWFDGIANQTTPPITYNNPFLPKLQTALNATVFPGGVTVTAAYTGNQPVPTTPAQRIQLTVSAGVIAAAPSTQWPTRFALNTRLGFPNVGLGIDTPSSTIIGTFLPNLIRSKVVYVLCNVVMNDSISTDGLRTAIAKIPVNSTYGGLTIYNPPVLNYNRLVPSQGYQNIQVSLLDDQYQPYPIQTEEFCELELVFRYSADKDKAFNF